MKTEHLKRLYANQFEFDPLDIDIRSTYGFLTISGHVIMPIKTSKIFDRTQTVQIEDESFIPLGQVYFVANKNYEINALPEDLYKIYLAENEDDISVGNHQEYVFKYDYILIKTNRAEEYFNKFKHGTLLWGDFYHIESELLRGFNFNSSLNKISVIDCKTLDSQSRSLHYELISETNCFHRFLRYYHMLEMHFDMHTAKKISNLLLQGGNEKQISSLLRDYNREDLSRLQSLIENYVNPLTLQENLKIIFNYMEYAEDIFYNFGKVSNPLRKWTDLTRLKENGSFTENSTQNFRGSNTHNKFLAKISSYWIYRIRSSIAHRKLGEYVMDQKDEKFVVNFAEPLIKAIYRDFFINFNHQQT
ncbi:hypothetical protein G5B30_00965 [Sphingobacterium sp. SGG-5]|uniref:hypothetical protein n=1 Tax=Sphingobacterium sp. SGG-5 TaxID=2710881 RepID=UPI0013EB84A2|nr:hypothetical protein [Sphingobacterium sp. SGG-5]NGM60475.1 hypothetical protein [Sphingobacterium sp. SGG-5]